MEEQLNRIRQKLSTLKGLDSTFSLFGSSNHMYILNSQLDELQLSDFENRNEIKLPTGYRNFLKYVGNGGAGPYYGIVPIEKCLMVDLDSDDYDDLIMLNEPFPHTQPWNLDFSIVNEENEELANKIEEEYFQKKWINGLIRVSNYGCGVFINLIVNGAEYGNIWTDDRINRKGILPFKTKNSKRVDFLNWYEEWLDESLERQQI